MGLAFYVLEQSSCHDERAIPGNVHGQAVHSGTDRVQRCSDCGSHGVHLFHGGSPRRLAGAIRIRDDGHSLHSFRNHLPPRHTGVPGMHVRRKISVELGPLQERGCIRHMAGVWVWWVRVAEFWRCHRGEQDAGAECQCGNVHSQYAQCRDVGSDGGAEWCVCARHNERLWREGL